MSAADQRFYASTYGRFNTPDPYQASGGPKSPASWNRYSYTRGDPINRYDPKGLDDCSPPLDPDAVGLHAFDECGGGGGGSCFLDCSPDPDPDPGEGGGGQGGGGGTTAQPPPACDIMEQDTGVALGQVHTYLDVDLYGVTHILEGINSRTVLGAVPFLRLSYLNGSDTPTGALNIDDPATDHVDYNSANQPGLLPALVCIDAQILINATDGFPQNKIKYDLLGKSAPNSNSFIHYLATLVPGLSIVQPPGAVGWNHPIFPGIRPPRFNP